MSEVENIQERNIFARNVPGSFEVLSKCTIGIAGAGGLGSNIAVQLTRSGIGKLVVADFDMVAPENLNRQHFFVDHVGLPKVDALEGILHRINPDLKYEPHKIILKEENIPEIFSNVDVLVEAFDDAGQKKMLIETWVSLNNGKLLVCASGLSGYGKSEEIKIHRFTRNLVIVGDQKSKISEGLMAPRVTMVASIQANLVIEYLIDNFERG